MFRKSVVRKVFLFFTLINVISFALYAKDQTDYFELARSGTAQEVQKNFKSKPNLKNQVFGTNRETFLMLCLRENRSLEVIQACIIAESNVMAKAKDGRTPIMFAAQYTTYSSVLEQVVKSGTVGGLGLKKRVQQTDSLKKTAFDYAKLNENFDTYSILLKFGEDPAVEAERKKAEKAAKKASKKPEPQNAQQPVVEIKKEYSYEPKYEAEEPDISENTEPEKTVEPEEIKRVTKEPQEPVPLNMPVTEASDSALSALTEQKDELAFNSEESNAEEPETVPEETSYLKKQQDQIKEYAQTFLYDYAEEKNYEDEKKPVRKFVDDPNKADSNGVTLLMKAAKAGNDWDVKNLLAHGADVQLRDKDGWTALMYAVRYQNSMSIVNMLVEKGAYVRVRNKYNATPLLLAADYSQNPEILEFLLKNRSVSEDEVFKAFIFAITGNSASDHIRSAKVQLFLDRDIQLNRVWKGKTPLMYAAQYSSSTDVIQLLLDNGAKPGIRDQNGLTAFDYAKVNTRLNHDNTFWALNSSTK